MKLWFVSLFIFIFPGVIAKQIKTEPTRQFILGPNESKRVIYHVDSDEYLDKLVDQTGLKMTVVGHVEVNCSL